MRGLGLFLGLRLRYARRSLPTDTYLVGEAGLPLLTEAGTFILL